MTNKIFHSTILVAVVVLLCSLTIIMGFLYGYFSDVQVHQLRDELSIAAVGTNREGTDFLSEMSSDQYRMTWVAADGTVIYDTYADAATMENHAGREEIQEALQVGTGSASRYSGTLLERTVYEAVRLADGSVLRISVSRASLVLLVLGMLQPMVVVALLAIALSAMLAKRVSRRIVEPMNRLDLEHPLENDTYPELSPLLIRINQQHLEIQHQLQILKRKTDEFDQIVANMSEGLVLLDKDRKVISLNPAAQRLFGADASFIGRDFLAVDRKPEMQEAVETACAQGHSQFRARRGGRAYQFSLNRIESGGKAIGAVVLAFDITEAQDAERSRREFSANVSHELKSPLQSIIGSAELLENKLVREEDVPRFIERIHREAARLLNLIEDIIRLSQLDEGVELPSEPVELLALAEETAAALRSVHPEIPVTVKGTPCTIQGVRRLLYEIVYNLCDNAMKYNVPGGSVAIRVEEESGHTVLTVADTGIGIPPEHQSRVFERFYRVDKSHSKQSGGTGLGLSIVKHAAQYHHAKLDLQSTPGKGTTIRVIF